MHTKRKSLMVIVIIVIVLPFMVGCNWLTITPIPVTGVSIDQGNQTIAKDGTVQLSATVTPSNAIDKRVSWTSGDSSIAAVSSLGLVTGGNPGGTTITVTTTEGGKHDTIEIIVNAGGAQGP
ncbi:MAG: Ig-like domain-containing protein [Sphaerochaeta sp.]|nr:Ig-like domain-containing protein [Sphaerochaeta sp.]